MYQRINDIPSISRSVPINRSGWTKGEKRGFLSTFPLLFYLPFEQVLAWVRNYKTTDSMGVGVSQTSSHGGCMSQKL